MNATKSQTFVSGAFAMAFAGLISKVLGIVYVVPLQNMVGSYGMGLYTISYSIYTILLYIALAGFPLALSKAVAERVAINDYDGAEQIFKVSLRLMIITGVTSFLIMFLSSSVYAKIAGDTNATLAVRAIAFAVLVVPIMAAFRGYMQGHQNMGPSATSQVVEQFVRVVFILAGTYVVLKMSLGIPFAVATATLGGVVGAIASLIFVVFYVMKMRKGFAAKLTGRKSENVWPTLRKLIKYAIPISLASLVLPISQLVDTMTVINMLKWIGWVQEAATEGLGILTNDGYRLIQLPVTLATAIGTSLLPAISEAIAIKNEQMLHDRVSMAFRLISMTLLPSAAILFVLAGPIDMALFKHTDGANVIRIITFAGFFMSFEILTTYMLQGIGRMYLPVRNMLIGTGTKLAFNLLLIPLLGLEGAALSAALSYVVSSYLNIRSVFKITNLHLNWGMMLMRPLFATLLTGLMLWGGHELAFGVLSQMVHSDRLVALLELIILLPLTGLFYGLMTLMFGSITRAELAYIPKIGPRLGRLVERFPWMMR